VIVVFVYSSVTLVLSKAEWTLVDLEHEIYPVTLQQVRLLQTVDSGDECLAETVAIILASNCIFV